MDYSLILKNVSNHIVLDTNEEQYFTALLEFRKIRNKQCVLSEGEVSNHIYFVTRGCLRGFTVDKSGTEHVLSFAPEDWWIGDLYSYVTRQPGNLYIEALETSEVLILSREKQEMLYRDVPKFERFFRILAENSLVASQQRLHDRMSLTAGERYERFCQRYPTLIQRLPQKQIASYIGVTPEFFSKMRSSLLKNS